MRGIMMQLWCGGDICRGGVRWRVVACLGVSWRGVAWRVVAWYGGAYRGVVWYGMVWCGVALCGVVRRGVVCGVWWSCVRGSAAGDVLCTYIYMCDCMGVHGSMKLDCWKHAWVHCLAPVLMRMPIFHVSCPQIVVSICTSSPTCTHVNKHRHSNHRQQHKLSTNVVSVWRVQRLVRQIWHSMCEAAFGVRGMSTPCRAVPCHVVSCRVMSCRVMSCRVVCATRHMYVLYVRPHCVFVSAAVDAVMCLHGCMC